VDDEPMLLELAAAILQPQGYTIRTFRDPQTAAQAFASAQPPPTLVITDYAMHTMNGVELIEACRRIAPKQKFLMLSGTVDERALDGAAWKPDRFLAKPYSAHQLIQVVESMVG